MGRGQRRRGDIRRSEDQLVVAPARRQRQHLRWTIGARELRWEPQQGRRAGPTPAVDGLVGVPDGREGHGRVVEQRPEQRQLRLRRVLELVEQDGLEPLTLDLADEWHRAGNASGERHLVGEVQRLALPLQPHEGLDDRQDRTSLAQHRQRVLGRCEAALALAIRQVLQRRDDGVEVVHHLCRGADMLGHLAGKGHHGLDDRRLGLGHHVHRPVPPRDRLRGQLPGAGLGEDAELRLDPEP